MVLPAPWPKAKGVRQSSPCSCTYRIQSDMTANGPLLSRAWFWVEGGCFSIVLKLNAPQTGVGILGLLPNLGWGTPLLPAPSCRGEENRKSVPFGLKSALQKPLCMNAEYFGLGRRRALGSCGSHGDFPLGGNASSLQCRVSGAGVFGKAVSTQLLELRPCCRANSFQV